MTTSVFPEREPRRAVAGRDGQGHQEIFVYWLLVYCCVTNQPQRQAVLAQGSRGFRGQGVAEAQWLGSGSRSAQMQSDVGQAPATSGTDQGWVARTVHATGAWSLLCAGCPCVLSPGGWFPRASDPGDPGGNGCAFYDTHSTHELLTVLFVKSIF